MTLLMWVGCNQYALLATDQRASLGNSAVVKVGGQTITMRAEQGVYLEGFKKAIVSTDARDIYAIAGDASRHYNYLETLKDKHGFEGDTEMFNYMANASNLDKAHDLPRGEYTISTILHAYRVGDRNVCGQSMENAMYHHRTVTRGGADALIMAYAGSGAGYAQMLLMVPTEAAKWKAIESNVTDWKPAAKYLKKLFSAITILDDSVGDQMKLWLCDPTGHWAEVDTAKL